MTALSSVIYDVQGYLGGHIYFKQMKEEGNMEESYVKGFMDLPGLEEMQILSTHISSPSFCIYIFVGHGIYGSGCVASTKGQICAIETDDNSCYIPSYHFHNVCIFYCSYYIRLLRKEDVESSVLDST